MSRPIILIFGAGPNVGASVAKAFATKGYAVALASRRLKASDSTADTINIPTDVSDPAAVITAFETVKKELGSGPSVVVYNASAVTFNKPEAPLAVPLSDFVRNANINIVSAYLAAQQAVLSFEQLPADAGRTFIYTGNFLNVTTLPQFMDQGVGKSGAAHFIQSASKAYKEKGFKFYYADERKPEGGAAFKIDGEAHAKLYLELAEGKEQGPWQQTFVKGVGYKAFPTL